MPTIRTTIVPLAAAIAFAAAGHAQAPAAPKAVTQTHTATTVHADKPAIGAKTVTVTQNKTSATAVPTTPGKMAVYTTKSGKKITYDCSKAGNKNKAVCKG